MTTLEIWLIVSLLFSVLINLFLVLFSREQSQRISYISQNLSDLVEMLDNFRKHLKNVYSLETFYGDQTLSHLLEHSRMLSEILKRDYSSVTNLTEPLEIIVDEEEEVEKTSEEEEQEVKDVFYGGTRERNT